MKKLKIGLLIPYSGVFPALKEDLSQGLMLAMPPGHEDRVSFLYEYIHMGDLKHVQEAIQKLIRFHRVDLIAGIVNTNVIGQCTDTFAPSRVPVFVHNLGARTPTASFSNPYLRYNSLHLWKSQWEMGRWAQQQFGGLPSISMAFYESGYSLHECFKLGAAASGADKVILNVLRHRPDQVVDTTPLIDYLQTQQSAHAHVLLSGKEAQHFLEQYRHTGCNTSLSISPFMADASLMEDQFLTEGMYHATTWSADMNGEANREFTAAYEERFGERPAVFAMLGYESGRMIFNDMDDTKINGPRGPVDLSTGPLSALPAVYIRKSVMRENAAVHETVHTGQGVHWSDPSLAIGAAQELSGWQNPYLCV
ncbi:ABC transporter substrate-binding protein [Chitinophaga barathri]|uniref:Leucine-binding protein domain-containing protein n=1 Tax=Chitinophaga barathri TaxID=1647451 RepID=A0A3N4MFT9_9BACT|nr:ABC transporter substrate-binding protein [Chitinophaga barathri]RPD42824.1 hypothetical protein EG028_00560 [Chitinophaga barathri]